MKKTLHQVSKNSTPDREDQQFQQMNSARMGQLQSSRNHPVLHPKDSSKGITHYSHFKDEKRLSPENVKFNQRNYCKKFTTPTTSNQNSAYSSYTMLNSPSAFKVIDLRNPTIKKLVIDSLNEIIQERRKSRVEHNKNYNQIVSTMPQQIRIQESIDRAGTVLVESQVAYAHQGEGRNGQRRVSRMSSSGHQSNGGGQQHDGSILKMSPQSQMKLFEKLQKIYEEQDPRRDAYQQEANSPEYTIVTALDDSCVLFAIKEGSCSSSPSLDSSQKLISPLLHRNFYDPQTLESKEVQLLLSERLQKLENQENRQRNLQEESGAAAGGQLVETYSLDRRFLMIHPRSMLQLNLNQDAQVVSRDSKLNYYNLEIENHALQLQERLHQIQDEEGSQVQSPSNHHHHHQGSESLHSMEFHQQSPRSSEPLSSRGGEPLPAPKIDIDLLISKLLQIPSSDAILEGIFNLSESHTPNVVPQNVQTFQPKSDSEEVSSSGGMTPKSNSLSTPIQARMFQERGQIFNGGKPLGLDLRSPHTKFDLLKKLYEVKEQNNPLDEEEDEQEDQEMRDFALEQNQTAQLHPQHSVLLRGLNDFSRLYINEEEEDLEQENCSFEQERREQTKTTSLESPNRSINSVPHRNCPAQSNPPSIELLLKKLKNLEQRTMRNGVRVSALGSQSSGDNGSPLKGMQPEVGSASNLLEQVIKRLERLKSRDNSVGKN